MESVRWKKRKMNFQTGIINNFRLNIFIAQYLPDWSMQQKLKMQMKAINLILMILNGFGFPILL